MGTGLRAFGATQPLDGSFRGTASVSHLHWDHVQGLPFFPPVLVAGAEFDIYAPLQDDGRSVEEAFDFFMQPPYFPIRVTDLPSRIRLLDCPEGRFKIGSAEVLARHIPHIGADQRLPRRAGAAPPSPTCPTTSSRSTARHAVPDAVLELADGADLLIHDSQYTIRRVRQEGALGPLHLRVRACSWPSEAGAKRLALFHHDPARTTTRSTTCCAACSVLRRRLGPRGARRGRGHDRQLRRRPERRRAGRSAR